MYPHRTEKFKIFHVVNSLKVGGLEQVVVNLINGLDSRRYDHVLCCIDAGGPMQQRLTVPVKLYCMNKGQKRDLLLPFKILKLLWKEKPDIIHTRNWSTIDAIIAAFFTLTPVVVHDEHGREATDPEGVNLKRKLVRRGLSARVARFIPVSGELATWLVKDVRVSPDKVQSIVNGVDTAAFVPAGDKTAAKSRMGLGADSFVVGFVGRLDPVKDLCTLLEAFALFSSKGGGRDKVLVIAGNGPEREMLEAKSRALCIHSRVVFLGECLDIPSVMACLDVFVLTSIAEGIPMTILEAMASGLPVVSTNVGGVSQLVSNGNTGILVPSRGTSEIAAAFQHYLHNSLDLKAHGKNGRKVAEQEFSLNRMISNYHSLYEELLLGVSM